MSLLLVLGFVAGAGLGSGAGWLYGSSSQNTQNEQTAQNEQKTQNTQKTGTIKHPNLPLELLEEIKGEIKLRKSVIIQREENEDWIADLKNKLKIRNSMISE